jgi:hypothetical protein
MIPSGSSLSFLSHYFSQWYLTLLIAYKEEEKLGSLKSTLMFTMAFTGKIRYQPQTNAARLFTVSVCFWALVMGASYTANLASALVVRMQPKIQVTSLEQGKGSKG